jgi:hypothetical protein
MNHTDEIISQFKEKVCQSVEVQQEGNNRYHVFTPFEFGDGDSFVIILKKEGNDWFLTDEGHTIMHLSYWIDEKYLSRGNYWKIIANTIKRFNLIHDEGEILLKIEDDHFGDALFSFIQALTRITDVTLLKREKTSDLFQKDLEACVKKHVVSDHLFVNWHDPIKDPKEIYVIDYRVNGNINITPVFVFGVDDEIKALRSAVTLRQFKLWGIKNFSIGVFEERGDINQKSADKFSDICDKTYSNFYSNEDDLVGYLEGLLSPQNYFIPTPTA